MEFVLWNACRRFSHPTASKALRTYYQLEQEGQGDSDIEIIDDKGFVMEIHLKKLEEYATADAVASLFLSNDTGGV